MKLKNILDRGTQLVEKEGNLLFLQWNEGVKDKFFQFDTKLREISEDTYKEAIGGPNWQKIEKQLKVGVLHDYSWTYGPNSTRYYLYYQKGILYGFDKSGEMIYEFDVEKEINSGHAIYDIKFQAPDFMWLAFPAGQTVTQISLTERKETYRIGEYTFDEVYDPLSYPESLFLQGQHLYISNMGTGILHKLNLKTNKLKTELEIDGQLWEYLPIADRTFLKIDEGIFLLEE